MESFIGKVIDFSRTFAYRIYIIYVWGKNFFWGMVEDKSRSIRIWLKMINPCDELLEREAKDIYLNTVSPHRNFDLSRYQLVGARYQWRDTSSRRLGR